MPISTFFFLNKKRNLEIIMSISCALEPCSALNEIYCCEILKLKDVISMWFLVALVEAPLPKKLI